VDTGARRVASGARRREPSWQEARRPESTWAGVASGAAGAGANGLGGGVAAAGRSSLGAWSRSCQTAPARTWTTWATCACGSRRNVGVLAPDPRVTAHEVARGEGVAGTQPERGQVEVEHAFARAVRVEGAHDEDDVLTIALAVRR